MNAAVAMTGSVAEVLEGLKAPQKRIPSKYFYDRRGSELFDRISELPEYYPTRAEARIMREHLDEIAARVGPRAAVIELGAGSGAKARSLLRRLDHPVAYVPVEISGDYLRLQALALRRDFPGLVIEPVVADFTQPFDLPRHAVEPKRNLIFFPGSTIGNLSRADALDLLERMRRSARPGGAMLIGVDLIKSPETVAAAYNDAAGITAEFNRNALHHLNHGFGADFRPELFRHEAVYDPAFDRIEMRLIALIAQTATLAGESIAFEAGEYIVTEHSHKYSIASFADLAAEAGWRHETAWTDKAGLFSVHFLEAPP
jgi:dimethylhistidine N-methyltransferase